MLLFNWFLTIVYISPHVPNTVQQTSQIPNEINLNYSQVHIFNLLFYS